MVQSCSNNDARIECPTLELRPLVCREVDVGAACLHLVMLCKNEHLMQQMTTCLMLPYATCLLDLWPHVLLVLALGLLLGGLLAYSLPLLHFDATVTSMS